MAEETKVGVQLIIYGQRWQDDLPGVLDEVAAEGYQGVETAPLIDMYPDPADLKKLANDRGLTLTGFHMNYAMVTDPDVLGKNLDYLREIGAGYVICSGVSDPQTVLGYEESAKAFDGVGTTVREAGLKFLYHNHAFEFEPREKGQKGIHVLGQQTLAMDMQLCMDVYWIHVGGEDPAEFIQRYVDRSGYYHFKDGGQGYFKPLGEGEVDIPRALTAAQAAGADWIIVEQDRPVNDPRSDIAASRKYLRGLGV